jgi:lysine biosynthesis protein LysW
MINTSICPSCGSDIEVHPASQIGQRIICPSCDAVLKVVWLDPVEVDWFNNHDLDEDDEYDDGFFEDEDFDDEDEFGGDDYDDEDEFDFGERKRRRR